MRSFQFPLERILNWRRKEFEAEEARLGGLMAEQKRLEAARREMLAAWDRAGNQLLAAGSVDGSDLAALGRFRVRLERDLEANVRERQDALQRLAAQQSRVLAAHRRVRLIEKLRQRRLDEWTIEWNRELETFAGEAFLARWRAPGGESKRELSRRETVNVLPRPADETLQESMDACGRTDRR